MAARRKSLVEELEGFVLGLDSAPVAFLCEDRVELGDRDVLQIDTRVLSQREPSISIG